MRIRDILETAGTEDRIIKSIDDISIVDKQIDYEAVDIKLNSMRKQSFDFLKQSFALFNESLGDSNCGK